MSHWNMSLRWSLQCRVQPCDVSCSQLQRVVANTRCGALPTRKERLRTCSMGALPTRKGRPLEAEEEQACDSPAVPWWLEWQ